MRGLRHFDDFYSVCLGKESQLGFLCLTKAITKLLRNRNPSVLRQKGMLHAKLILRSIIFFKEDKGEAPMRLEALTAFGSRTYDSRTSLPPLPFHFQDLRHTHVVYAALNNPIMMHRTHFLHQEVELATATRDLNDLIEKGALVKKGERNATRYYLNLSSDT